MMDQEVAKKVDLALREIISNLIIANTELKIRVDLLTAHIQTLTAPKEESHLRAVQD